MKNIVILGGGMSGMVAAINAAGKENKVTVIERQDRIGKKLLLTGNGRCNLTNRFIDSSRYLTDEPKLLQAVLDDYQPLERDFWDSLGLMTKEKNGCIYPLSGQASTVQNCLRLRLAEKKVTVKTDYEAEEVGKKKGKFYIISKGKKEITEADVLILACGGKAGVYGEQYKNGYALCNQLGHTVLPCYPALVQTICEGNFKSISGIRTDVHISLFIDRLFIASEEGELQVTEKGLSGIAVFQLTRYLGIALKEGKKAVFKLNFIPQMEGAQWKQSMQTRRRQMALRTAEDFFTGILNKKLVLMFLKKQGISPGQPIGKISDEKFYQLLGLFQNFPVEIIGLNDFAHAQISTGGVPLSEVDKTLASRMVKNLYLTGEMLNVSGACGGYNLHFAAATGYLAGRSAGK